VRRGHDVPAQQLQHKLHHHSEGHRHATKGQSSHDVHVMNCFIIIIIIAEILSLFLHYAFMLFCFWFPLYICLFCCSSFGVTIKAQQASGTGLTVVAIKCPLCNQDGEVKNRSCRSLMRAFLSVDCGAKNE
jgi:hypothetical protein